MFGMVRTFVFFPIIRIVHTIQTIYRIVLLEVGFGLDNYPVDNSVDKYHKSVDKIC